MEEVQDIMYEMRNDIIDSEKAATKTLENYEDTLNAVEMVDAILAALIENINYTEGQEIVVGIYVKCSGSGNGAWGKIDDALLNSQAE